MGVYVFLSFGRREGKLRGKRRVKRRVRSRMPLSFALIFASSHDSGLLRFYFRRGRLASAAVAAGPCFKEKS